MGISLKDALKKAGLKSSETTKKEDRRGERSFKRKKSANHESQRPSRHSSDRRRRDEGDNRRNASESRRDLNSRKTRTEGGIESSQPKRVTTCGACRSPSPDVEYYAHDRKGLSARWLCAVCADKFMISDEGRLTNQSDLSRKNLFKREYGRTKRYGFVKDLNDLANGPSSSNDNRRPHRSRER